MSDLKRCMSEAALAIKQAETILRAQKGSRSAQFQARNPEHSKAGTEAQSSDHQLDGAINNVGS
jgi:hypothetical protein